MNARRRRTLALLTLLFGLCSSSPARAAHAQADAQPQEDGGEAKGRER
ncbi:hypothetical protein G6O69_02820 [Pseudenhygromyxa sp. WMMC2535]|nr:hypothetical protein [Pseudenhygromyxa sp. WMMC2535]NVB36749.1 hypothetical protein [Pseudenhygromyxa sp. WMMC2535]